MKHPWSQRQDDGTYVVTCPIKQSQESRVKAAALVKIADMRAKRKARQQGWRDKKKQKNAANAAFEALPDQQKAQ